MTESWAIISTEPGQLIDSVLAGTHMLSASVIRFYDTFKNAFDVFQTLNGGKEHLLIQKSKLELLTFAPTFFNSHKN